MKKGHFIITYLAPIKKLEKIQFWKIELCSGGPES